MNSNLNPQIAESELARVDYRETQADIPAPSAREVWKATQRELRLALARSNRPFGKRARKAGKAIARQSWRILREIHKELAPRFASLRLAEQT